MNWNSAPGVKGIPHRGARAKFGRALHTEAGRRPGKIYAWGNPRSGVGLVTLERDTQILLANNVDDSCAIWNATHENTSVDGDIGNCSDDYSIDDAILMKSGEVHKIGILTPHESLPVSANVDRQFLRIMSKGVSGREPYFTENPLLKIH